jgi:hypothetical protein
MRPAANVEKAKKFASHVDLVTMSDRRLFNYFLHKGDEGAKLYLKFVGESARPHLLERMAFPEKDTGSLDIGSLDRSDHSRAFDKLCQDRLTHEALLGLTEQAYDFVGEPESDPNWRLVLEMCKTHVYRRLHDGGAGRHALEYSKAKAIDFILRKQFETDIKTLNDYLHVPMFYHDQGVVPVDEQDIELIRACIFHGRMVVAACDLETEASFTKMKEMKTSSLGGKWRYGEPLERVRAFLAHALEFEYKLRRGVFDDFTQQYEGTRQHLGPLPKF